MLLASVSPMLSRPDAVAARAHPVVYDFPYSDPYTRYACHSRPFSHSRLLFGCLAMEEGVRALQEHEIKNVAHGVMWDGVRDDVAGETKNPGGTVT